MKTIKLITLTLLLAPFTALAQNIQYSSEQNEIRFSQVGMDPKVLKSKYEGVDGSPYLFDDWVSSTLIDKSGKVLKDAPIKYDQVDGVFMFKRKSGHIYTFSNDVLKVEMTNPKDLSVMNFESGFAKGKNTNESTFFQTFNKGEIQLLAEVRKSIEESRNYMGVTTKSIQSITKYYIANQKMEPVEVKLDTKSVLAVLNSPAAADIVKNRKLNLKKIEDVVVLLDQINGIKVK